MARPIRRLTVAMDADIQASSSILALKMLGLGIVICCLAGCQEYPVAVGPSSELRRANSSEVTLVSKTRPVVLLGPYVSVVTELDQSTFVLRNVQNERFREKYSEFRTGYYLFVCPTNEVLWLSDDRDEALSMAKRKLGDQR